MRLSPQMSLRLIAAVALVATVAVPAISISAQTYVDASASAQIDPSLPPYRQQYLSCMQSAVQRRENDVTQAYRDYSNAYQAFLQARMSARVQIWTITDDRDRRSADRDLEREFRTDERELKGTFDDQIDEIDDRLRDERRECDRQRRDAERAFRNSQRSSRSSSSRSSISNTGTSTGGYGCQPYVCSDGRTYPTCSAEGYPINYFANPCQFN
jgi:hypothetical protein